MVHVFIEVSNMTASELLSQKCCVCIKFPVLNFLYLERNPYVYRKIFCGLVMFDTTDFLSDPILSKIQAGIGDSDPIPIVCANTPNVSGKSKKRSVFQIIAS